MPTTLTQDTIMRFRERKLQKFWPKMYNASINFYYPYCLQTIIIYHYQVLLLLKMFSMICSKLHKCKPTQRIWRRNKKSALPWFCFGEKHRSWRDIKLYFKWINLRQKRFETPIRLGIDCDSFNTFRTAKLQLNNSPSHQKHTNQQIRRNKFLLRKKKILWDERTAACRELHSEGSADKKRIFRQINNKNKNLSFCF